MLEGLFEVWMVSFWAWRGSFDTKQRERIVEERVLEIKQGGQLQEASVLVARAVTEL